MGSRWGRTGPEEGDSGVGSREAACDAWKRKHGRQALGAELAIHSGRTALLPGQGLCSRQISRASDGLAPLLDTYFNSYTAETWSMGINALLSDPPNEQRQASAGTARPP